MMPPFNQSWSIAEAAQLACLIEAAAPKVGNVHPGATFSDMQFGHFVSSATVSQSVLQAAENATVGSLVLRWTQATQQRVGRNTNLGTILLLAPIAVAARETPELPATAARKTNATTLQQSVASVLAGLSPTDCEQVYEAIRTANPGGLGQQPTSDVSNAPGESLVSAMSRVADIDAVARQYTNNYADIFEHLLPCLNKSLETALDPLHAIVGLQLQWLAHEPDGLIARKLGLDFAKQVQQRAQRVLEDEPSIENWLQCSREIPLPVREFDSFLRADGHRRNPGTTADLIACTLFCRFLLGPQ